MPTNKQLQEQIDQLMDIVQRLGGSTLVQRRPDEPRADYIEYGSKAHAQFLGLIEVDKDSVDQAVNEDKFVVYKSRETGRCFRLQDELGLFEKFPSVAPEKVALVVLRQKIGSLESGKPKVPENAPNLWRPDRVMAR